LDKIPAVIINHTTNTMGEKGEAGEEFIIISPLDFSVVFIFLLFFVIKQGKHHLTLRIFYCPTGLLSMLVWVFSIEIVHP
jgi:hypothetical protein